jgi:hypothetical protein
VVLKPCRRASPATLPLQGSDLQHQPSAQSRDEHDQKDRQHREQHPSKDCQKKVKQDLHKICDSDAILADVSFLPTKTK